MTEQKWLAPTAWERVLSIKVLDPDGWRVDGKSYDEPISEAEFRKRAAMSTSGPWAFESSARPAPSTDDPRDAEIRRLTSALADLEHAAGEAGHGWQVAQEAVVRLEESVVKLQAELDEARADILPIVAAVPEADEPKTLGRKVRAALEAVTARANEARNRAAALTQELNEAVASELSRIAVSIDGGGDPLDPWSKAEAAGRREVRGMLYDRIRELRERPPAQDDRGEGTGCGEEPADEAVGAGQAGPDREAATPVPPSPRHDSSGSVAITPADLDRAVQSGLMTRSQADDLIAKDGGTDG